MTTARVLLTGSLRLLRVVAEEETPTAQQLEDSLESMNQLLHALKSHNADIYFQNITLDAEVPVPPEHDRPLRYIMAGEMAPEFGTQMTPEVALREQDAWKVLQAYYGRVPRLKSDEGVFDRRSRYDYDITTDI